MTKERKSPQLKKQLQKDKDHFTFAEHAHAFRRQWRRKKTLVNRKYRRKSDELLSQAKPEISAADAELLVGDLTEAHLKKSISRDRIHKSSTVTVCEKIRIKQEKRVKSIGRKADSHRRYDDIAAQAIATLNSLEGKHLVDFVKRASRLVDGGDPIEWMRLQRSNGLGKSSDLRKSSDPFDRALYVLERLARGDGYYHDALRRNQQLCESFQIWQRNARRILAKEQRPAQRKLDEKKETEKKLKGLRRQSA